MVQRVSNAAVCTYWGYGPEEWRRPGPESVPPEPLKVLAYREVDEKLLLQLVGYPASRCRWIFAVEVKERWSAFYERWCIDQQASWPQTNADPMTPGAGERGDLQTIVGHRLEVDDDDGNSEFQLSCQWALGPESWEYEEDIQRVYNAAVLTYWSSEPEAREGKVPDRYLRFLSRDRLNGKLEVQWLGRSACSSDTTWVQACEAEKYWQSGYQEYVK